MAGRMGVMFKLIERLEETCFDEGRAALIAIGGLKDDVRRKDEEIVNDLGLEALADPTQLPFQRSWNRVELPPGKDGIRRGVPDGPVRRFGAAPAVREP